MYTTKTVTLPVADYSKRYDIVVIGGGTAGVMAAIAAAVSGKDVLSAERGYSLGGSATMAQVTPFMTVRIGDYNNSYLSTRMCKLLTEKGYLAPPWPGASNTMFSPVTMSVTLEEMAKGAGVDILYGAAFVDTVRENEHIQAILVQTLTGLTRIEADVFIDCTGDAQVAYMSGCPYAAGDPENNDQNQNMSLRFAVCDIDTVAVNRALYALGVPDVDPQSPHVYMALEWKDAEHAPLRDLFMKGLEAGELAYADGVYFQTFTAKSYGNSVMYFNCPEAPRCRHTVDPVEVSEGVIDCRASAVRIHEFLKKHIGGFENSTIISFAQLPGIRESRRIEGEYLLTIDDYNACRKFKDGIAQSAYPIDVHGKSALVHPRGFAPGEFFEIPYGTLVAKGVDNLLVAGRCISASFWAQSAIRIQLVCHALGEAAGLAASMALDLSCAVKSVDGAAVRAEMTARGGTFAAV